MSYKILAASAHLTFIYVQLLISDASWWSYGCDRVADYLRTNVILETSDRLLCQAKLGLTQNHP